MSDIKISFKVSEVSRLLIYIRQGFIWISTVLQGLASTIIYMIISWTDACECDTYPAFTSKVKLF